MEPQCSLVSITRSFRSKLLGTLLIYSLVVVVVPFRITLELPLSVEQDAESLRVEFGPYNDDLTRHADKIVRDHYHKLLFGSSSYYAQLCGDPPHYVNMRCVISDIESRMDIARSKALADLDESDEEEDRTLITIQFVGEDNAHMEAIIRRSDTARMAASRFCSSAGVVDNPQCHRIMMKVSQDALDEHGFNWRDGKPAILEHKPRLQWLKQRMQGTCPNAMLVRKLSLIDLKKFNLC